MDSALVQQGHDAFIEGINGHATPGGLP